MARPISPTLWRVVTGQGIIPRPRWLERMLTIADRQVPVTGPAQMTDKQLADLGLCRDDLVGQAEVAGWNPPEYWLQLPETLCTPRGAS